MPESLRQVGRYELLEVLGRGGTAIVYLANQPDLDRPVALKELSPHHAGDPSFAERFVTESRLIGAMNHSNIVTVHEFFQDDGLPYIAMEYLPRGSLRPYLRALTLPQIFGVAEDVLAALAHGESHHTIHRDLKPENLLITADGHVKISDYGVARALDTAVPRSFATMTGTTIGTPAYMAPEQALGETLGPQADLYSLGIIIWEALAGRPPFLAQDTPMAVLYKQIHEPARPIRELAPDVDPELARWLDVMLAKAPEDRFATATEAWDQLEEVAIELLGPRWRRAARIDLDAGDEPASSPGPRGGLIDTESDLPTPDRAQARLSAVARDRELPRQETGRRGGGETLLRNSRRHADIEAEAHAPPPPSQRWRLWLAAAAVALIAAAAGVGVGLATTPAAPRGSTRTQTTPAVLLSGAVRPILAHLANSQRRGLKQLGSAKTRTAQSAAALGLERDFLAARKALAKLPVRERRVSSAEALNKALEQLVGDWRKAGAAAKAGQSKAYNSLRGEIRRNSGVLVSRAAAADRT